MVIHHVAVPGLQFTWVWLAGKVTKVTLACPSHFIVNPSGFFNAPIYVLLVPPKDVPGGRHVFMFHVVRGGGCLLLYPGVTGVRNVEVIQVGPLGVPEGLRGGGGHRSCSDWRS